MNEIILNKNCLSKTLKIRKEQPYIQITNIRVPNLRLEDKIPGNSLYPMQLRCICKNKGNLEQSRSFSIGTFLEMNYGAILINWNKFSEIVNNSSSVDEVELVLDFAGNFNYNLELELSFYKDAISIQDPWDEFRNHLEEENNVNILFSASFGQGKTSFLNEFFRQHKHNYQVFKVYPVNFAVASNEDIFKYIKAELFFQLLKNKEVEFEKKDVAFMASAPKYFLKNASSLIAPFLKELPMIGQSILEVHDRLKEMSKEYFEEQKKQSKDDKSKAIDFLEEFYEKEGSLYESNFYTNLIRNLLQKLYLKSNSTKQNVLIIDDLDRMDPEHIFRILNVLSAHFDSPEYGLETGLPNKFGFHKIIIVGDYSNLHKIFAHRFGISTDFGGYINKYYSKKVFEYDNRKAISSLILKMESKHESRSIVIKILAFVLRDLLDSNNLSLREILKWKAATELNSISSKDKNYAIFFNSNELITITTTYSNSQLVLFQVIYLLLKIWDENILIKKLESCKEKSDGKNFRRAPFDFLEIAGAGLLVLSNETKFKHKGQYIIDFDATETVIHIEEVTDGIGYEYFKCVAAIDKSIGNRLEDLIYPSTFYKVLISNVEKYKSMGGLGDV